MISRTERDRTREQSWATQESAAIQWIITLDRARSTEHEGWSKRCGMIDCSDDSGETQWNRCVAPSSGLA